MKRSLTPLLLALLAGCPRIVGPDGDDGVALRVANESAQAFERVIVRWPGLNQEFGPIASGASSDYRAVDFAHRYAYIEVHLANDTLILQTIDYVGESPLPGGRYTYALDVDSGGPFLQFSFRAP